MTSGKSHRDWWQAPARRLPKPVVYAVTLAVVAGTQWAAITLARASMPKSWRQTVRPWTHALDQDFVGTIPAVDAALTSDVLDQHDSGPTAEAPPRDAPQPLRPSPKPTKPTPTPTPTPTHTKRPELSLSRFEMTADRTMAHVGETITFSIHLKSEVDASVRITTHIPPNTTLAAPNAACDSRSTGHECEWLLDLDSGTPALVQLAVRVTHSSGGKVTNHAHAESSGEASTSNSVVVTIKNGASNERRGASH